MVVYPESWTLHQRGISNENQTEGGEQWAHLGHQLSCLFGPGRVNGFVEVELYLFHNVTIKEAFNYVILLSAESPSPAGLSSKRLSRKSLALNGCDHLYLTR